MASLPLESNLADIYKKAPQMPANAKKTVASWAPWISLIVGVLTLFTAWNLWHWAHFANSAVDYANSLCNAYRSFAPDSCAAISSASRLSLWVWLGIIFLAVEGVLYLLAFPGLRDRRRTGWKYLYIGALVNVVYAVISLFMSYNPAAQFIGALIGSAIGFWLLFQIREQFTGKDKAPATPKTPAAK